MIKNIIFDFGDVFINLDKPATHKKMASYGITNITSEMIAVYHKYETGNCTTEEFLSFFKETFPEISENQLKEAWNAILLDLPKQRFYFLQQLAKSKKYRLFLLSNTNALHISWIKENWGLPLYNSFKNCFEQFYLSHEIHLRKPNNTIYEYVLNENNLLAEECYFIDDTQENTDAAKTLNIPVWNINPENEDVVNLFSKKEFL